MNSLLEVILVEPPNSRSQDEIFHASTALCAGPRPHGQKSPSDLANDQLESTWPTSHSGDVRRMALRKAQLFRKHCEFKIRITSCVFLAMWRRAEMPISHRREPSSSAWLPNSVSLRKCDPESSYRKSEACQRRKRSLFFCKRSFV